MTFSELETVFNALVSAKYRINHELASSYKSNRRIDNLLGDIRVSLQQALKPIECAYRENSNAPEVPF